MATLPRYPLIHPSCLVEEETVSGYVAERYYPARLGELLNNRYRIIGKLGYGAASTVWLCRDVKEKDAYVALKIYVHCSPRQRELPAYTHINTSPKDHPDHGRIRKFLGSFLVKGPHGNHPCLIHEPMGRNFQEIVRDLFDDKMFDATSTRVLFRDILAALHYLHFEVDVIHTDLKPDNMLMGLTGPTDLPRFEQAEIDTPSARKELEDRTIYLSRHIPQTGEGAKYNLPAISDLSEARFGHTEQTGLIMPEAFRAPEVILGMPWSYPVDIWSLGLTIWNMFQGKSLFTSAMLDVDNEYSEARHLATMIATFDPPPLDFLQRSQKYKKFWDNNGNWIADISIPDISLEIAESDSKAATRNIS